MAKAVVQVATIPESVKAVVLEVRDELSWLCNEFAELEKAEDMGTFADVLETVMEYVEDVHSGLDVLEVAVKRKQPVTEEEAK